MTTNMTEAIQLPTKPLLQIDRIVQMDESIIETVKCISESDYFLQGHFRKQSIFPGFLLYESIVQAASILLQANYSYIKVSNTSARFLSMVVPGDKVHFLVKKKKIDENVYSIKGEGFVEGKRVIVMKAEIEVPS